MRVNLNINFKGRAKNNTLHYFQGKKLWNFKKIANYYFPTRQKGEKNKIVNLLFLFF